MTDRYAVWGNPVAHSQSPWIHAQFAAASGVDLQYEALLGDLDGFEEQVRQKFDEGYRGFNVTLPFKLRALALAKTASPSAALAGAANTLLLGGLGIEAHNTDGLGLHRDLQRLGVPLGGVELLILGAGGATRGILEPLLNDGAQVTIANRTPARAEEVAALFNRRGMGPKIKSLALTDLSSIQPTVILNATSTGLSEAGIVLPVSLWAQASTAYDLVYTPSGETPFTAAARAAGVERVADGLGMLIEQAAEAFYLWHGIRPLTAPVRSALRKRLHQTLRSA